MRKRRNQSGSRIERTPIAVGSPFLPAAFSGFRIAHISDLHNTQFGEENRLSLIHICMMIVRFLGNSMVELKEAVDAIWGQIRRDVLKKEPIRVRKY